MSRFTEWYISESLRNMGWPRPKGLFRKQMVATKVLDVVVEQAFQVAVGLGAGRPELGLACMADTYAKNPWTEESTASLLLTLKEGDSDIQRNPELPPWKALYVEHRVSSWYGNDVNWQELGEAIFVGVRGIISAKGIFWGLTHEGEMPEVFAKARQDYEQNVRFAVPAGLDVPVQFPWDSLEHFYGNCEDLVRSFESSRPPLPEIPSALRLAPEVSKRLAVSSRRLRRRNSRPTRRHE